MGSVRQVEHIKTQHVNEHGNLYTLHSMTIRKKNTRKFRYADAEFIWNKAYENFTNSLHNYIHHPQCGENDYYHVR